MAISSISPASLVPTPRCYLFPFCSFDELLPEVWSRFRVAKAALHIGQVRNGVVVTLALSIPQGMRSEGKGAVVVTIISLDGTVSIRPPVNISVICLEAISLRASEGRL